MQGGKVEEREGEAIVGRERRERHIEKRREDKVGRIGRGRVRRRRER